MATTFGVMRRGNGFIEVARRSSSKTGLKIEWLNELAEYLPKNTPVFALDNSPQGVNTIEDLVKIYKEDL